MNCSRLRIEACARSPSGRALSHVDKFLMRAVLQARESSGRLELDEVLAGTSRGPSGMPSTSSRRNRAKDLMDEITKAFRFRPRKQRKPRMPSPFLKIPILSPRSSPPRRRRRLEHPLGGPPSRSFLKVVSFPPASFLATSGKCRRLLDPYCRKKKSPFRLHSSFLVLASALLLLLRD